MEHLPLIAIVGRPNVGKSTLFNALTRSRDALVANQPGLTRDRRLGRGRVGPCPYVLIDTGGMQDDTVGTDINALITRNALGAVEEAEAVLLVVDGREGLTALDQEIVLRLRRYNTQLHLVINKSEGLDRPMAGADFQSLGFGDWYTVSATHRSGLGSMMTHVLAPFVETASQIVARVEEDQNVIRVAVIGRPNVGKSTLVNRMLGEERQLTYDQPGTTRDSIEIPFERQGQAYCLIDTAGIRRRPKVFETIEKFSVVKALEAIERAHVVIMVMDAREGMTDQDSRLLGHVLDSGRALVITMNKWDGMSHDDRESAKYSLSRKLHFIDFTRPRFISALHGSGVGELFEFVHQAWRAAHIQLPTPRLNDVLHAAVEAHPPPHVRGRRIKLRYIHQGGTHPPLFVIHGNQTESMPDAYRRYLVNTLRTAFELEGTPLHIRFKQSENPFQGRKNVLTPRQEQKRKRLLRHVKKS